MPARARARRLAPEARRPLILDAALALFAQRGYAGVSMEAVAAAAGVTKPVLYAAFSGKEDMFAALLDREEARLLGLVSRAITARDEDLEARVRAGFEAVFAALAAAPDSFRLVYLSPHGADPVIRERVESGRRRVESQLVEQAAARLAGDLDPVLVGRLTVAAGEIGIRILLAEPGRTTPEKLAARLARLLVAGETGLSGDGGCAR